MPITSKKKTLFKQLTEISDPTRKIWDKNKRTYVLYCIVSITSLAMFKSNVFGTPATKAGDQPIDTFRDQTDEFSFTPKHLIS